jgi:hypothetical protein
MIDPLQVGVVPVSTMLIEGGFSSSNYREIFSDGFNRI